MKNFIVELKKEAKDTLQIVFYAMIIIGVLFMLLAFFLPGAKALTQDEACNLVNENMTFEACSDFWVMWHNTTIIMIDNSSTETIIQTINNTYFIDNSTERIINNSQILNTTLNYTYQNNISNEQVFEAIKPDLEGFDERIIALETLTGINSDCDDFCQLKKNITQQIEIEKYQRTQCEIMPTLGFCKELQINSTKDKAEEYADMKEQIMKDLNMTGNQEDEKDDPNYLLYGLIAVIVFVIYLLWKKSEDKNKQPTMTEGNQYKLGKILKHIENKNKSDDPRKIDPNMVSKDEVINNQG